MADAPDPFAALKANLDQVGAFLRDIAPPLAGFRQALLKEGVPNQLAGELCRDTLREIIRAGRNQGPAKGGPS